MKHRAYVAVDYRITDGNLARWFRARCAGCAWRGPIRIADGVDGDDAHGRHSPEAHDAATDARNHRRRA